MHCCWHHTAAAFEAVLLLLLLLLLQVAEAMSGKDKVISVKPSTPMSEAAHLMLHHDVSFANPGSHMGSSS
jgi:hypothetical protein